MQMQDRIKEQRIKKGYTQEELANKLGLQKSAIAKYENGRVENIKRSIILKMSEILECTPCYLLGFENPIVASPAPVLSTDEQDLVDGYRQLNVSGQKQLQKQLSMMLNDDDYRKDTESDSKEAL